MSLVVAGGLFFAGCEWRTGSVANTTESIPATPIPSPSPTPSGTPLAQPADITVRLTVEDNSGQSGTAVVGAASSETVRVVLKLSGGTFTEPQPAHIHLGSCPHPGRVVYPLSNVVGGSSETLLAVSLEKLLATSPELAINVHRSEKDIGAYTACGDLK